MTDLNDVSQEFAQVSEKVHRKALQLFETSIQHELTQVPLLVLAVNDEDEIKASFLRFEGRKDKTMAFSSFLMGLRSKNFDPKYLFTATEGWMSAQKAPPGTDLRELLSRKDFKMPSQEADRIDVFTIAGASRDGYRYNQVYEIKRGPDEVPMGLVKSPAADEMNGFSVRPEADRTDVPDLLDRCFNMWTLINEAIPHITEGGARLNFQELTEKLESEGFDLKSGNYFP